MTLAKLIMLSVVSLVMFLGGIFIITTRIPFWSLLLGVAAIQIGIVFLIFTYEKLSVQSTKESYCQYVRELDRYPNKPVLNRG